MSQLICTSCKYNLLQTIGRKFKFSLGYESIGKCTLCNDGHTYELYRYEEIKNEIR